MNLVQHAKEYAYMCHRGTNHTYDNLDYVDTHVALVVKYVHKYISELTDRPGFFPITGYTWAEIVEAAAWLHDVVEDCRVTPNDIIKFFNNKGYHSNVGTQIATLVFALSNEKGWTRSARANDKYYMGMRNVDGAIFIKLCDRFANFEYSSSKGSDMAEKYRVEYPHFRKMLYSFEDSLHWMWHDLDNLIFLEKKIMPGTIVNYQDDLAIVINFDICFDNTINNYQTVLNIYRKMRNKSDMFLNVKLEEISLFILL